MGFLKRLWNVIRSWFNHGIEKLEDPEKQAELLLVDFKKDLAQIKSSTASVMADQKVHQKKVDELKANIDRKRKAAEAAVKLGTEDALNDARTLIASKQADEKNLVIMEQQAAQYEKAVEDLTEKFNEVSNKVAELEVRKDAIKSKVALANAQEMLNKTMESVGNITGVDYETFSSCEEKADKMLEKANANTQLNNELKKDENLVDKYSSGISFDSSVDDELEAIKKSLEPAPQAKPVKKSSSKKATNE